MLDMRLRYIPRRDVLVALGVIAADQATKWMVRREMALHSERELVPGLLSLLHGRNRGMAFGILSGAPLPYQDVVLALLGAAVLAGLVLGWHQLAAGSRLAHLALSLILGGAVGNLVDRVRLGYVTDFIHVYWRQYTWPDFNVGDAAITVGITLVLIDSLRARGRPEAAAGEAT